MNDKELMQQALEALTAYDGTNNASQRKRVLAALRERLAQPEMNQWQGLTDEERNNLWRNIIGWGDPSHDDEDLMKAIEAKLKEKNCGH